MAEYSILEQVKIRLKQFHIETVTNEDDTTSDVVVFDEPQDNPLIEQLIKQAKQDIVAMRNYPSTYTTERIEADLKNYEAVIANLVVYDMSQAGEEFMSSFSENGVSRNWRKRSELFVCVYPFAKVL
nr:MAG TPA: hypothetical protein [Bacteriophage sp.]